MSQFDPSTLHCSCLLWVFDVYFCVAMFALRSVTFSVEKSPVKYFIEEMYNGNSLRSTTTLGNEKERERVYDTIFRLPWRCELVIIVSDLQES